MNLHEYQAKQVLAGYGAPIPRGVAVRDSEAAVNAARTLGGDIWVVKAQVHAGGRGKGGGIRVCRTLEDVSIAASDLIGATIITHQTGPAGKPVHDVYIEEGTSIARELYLAMLVDRGTSRITIIASTEGGMDIEEVAASTPEKISTITIEPATSVQPHHGRRLASILELDRSQTKQAADLLKSMYAAFIASDASLLEVNPLVVTHDGELTVLDCKFNLDDNAQFRQPDIVSMRDTRQEDPAERDADEIGLNYVKLDGNIGCMVNGAGLAMATMDICKLAGGEPANFLDVGGGASQEQVADAFRIIVSDPNVRVILVNIFGGIMRCDVIAEGIVAAARELELEIPLVVRLEGTNVEIGHEILVNSGLTITSAGDLADAATKAVAALDGTS